MRAVVGNGPLTEMRCPGCLDVLVRMELGPVVVHNAFALIHRCPSSRLGWISITVGPYGSKGP